jgi:hypothetical protein
MATTHSLSRHLESKQAELNRFIKRAQAPLKLENYFDSSLNVVANQMTESRAKVIDSSKIDLNILFFKDAYNQNEQHVTEYQKQNKEKPITREYRLNENIGKSKKTKIHGALKASYEKTVQALLTILEQ